jgi:hypothetical protein
MLHRLAVTYDMLLNITSIPSMPSYPQAASFTRDTWTGPGIMGALAVLKLPLCEGYLESKPPFISGN